MTNTENILGIQEKIFVIVVYVTWILYFLIAFGLSTTAPQYLKDLQYWVKIYISLFLIWRFNPLHKVKFTSLDAKIAFSAGLFLLATTAIGNILENYLEDIKIKVYNLYKNNISKRNNTKNNYFFY
jgi:hypothetical protein